ncbi:MAG: hypothetical protein EBT44_07175 [Actinobacteria bacterium]|uniref:Uncharacterized protein n=1 Tax=Candidatus Fonsibacter lacus TaxID=2576439 RepID=A0A965GEQ5_9PROT|nr:hypothetical protein [Candidatus Fonsibacter lacus]
MTHQGAPVFDLAYMSAHLHLKAIKRASQRNLVAQTLKNFFDSYQEYGGIVPANVSLHAGTIMAVRVVGISQVNYLDEAQKKLAISRAEDLLQGANVFIP